MRVPVIQPVHVARIETCEACRNEAPGGGCRKIMNKRRRPCLRRWMAAVTLGHCPDGKW